MSRSHDQFLVLVDGRAGDDQGTILHHPLFEELAAKGRTIPEVLLTQPYRVSQNLLAQRRELRYRDPLSQYHDGEGLAKTYDRHWLAAAAPVALPGSAGDSGVSGLVVVVQSDYQSVVQPARQLGRQFMTNSFWMFIVMVAVSLALWYIVVRMFREPTARLHRQPTPVPESTPVFSATTIPARPQEK